MKALLKKCSLFVFLFFMLTNCKNNIETKQGFEISGDIKGFNKPKIYLNIATDSGLINIDSSLVIDGKFTFKGASFPEPQNARIGFTANNGKIDFMFGDFILGNGITTITGDFNDIWNIKVKGSKEQEIFEKNNMAWLLPGKYYELSQQINQLEDDSIKNQQKIAELRTARNDVYEQYKTRIRKLIEQNPNSFYILYGLYFNKNNFSLKEQDSLLRLFDKPVLEFPTAIKFRKTIDNADKFSIGKQLPVFSLTDSSGKKTDLTSLRGKYVFLDFWASWCGPCRQQTPLYKTVYEQYKSDAFEMIGISIDTDADQWKKAIQNDHIPWLNVSGSPEEINAIKTTYNISSIPLNFLIDKEGKIIAVNMNEKELAPRLKAIFEH
jgi:peroxiredoxin